MICECQVELGWGHRFDCPVMRRAQVTAETPLSPADLLRQQNDARWARTERILGELAGTMDGIVRMLVDLKEREEARKIKMKFLVPVAEKGEGI